MFIIPLLVLSSSVDVVVMESVVVVVVDKHSPNVPIKQDQAMITF